MIDFKKQFSFPLRSFQVSELADLIKPDEVIGDSGLIIKGVNTLKDATGNEISFFHNSKYTNDLKNTNAGACIIRESDLPIIPSVCIALITSNPLSLWALVLDHFFPKIALASSISENASIDKSAQIGARCRIGHNVVIDAGVVIEDDCSIEANSYVGQNVIIRSGTMIGPNVTIMNAEIGHACIIHAGARIGQDGFGFTTDKSGIKKIQQLGGVVIGDNVEIGASTCVDRGALSNTCIGNNTKIDNLVQIAHNVVIGQNCFIAGQSGIAGSTIIGDGVMMGGQSGIAGHFKIGSGVMIAAGSGITSDIADGAHVGGYPAVDSIQWHRQTILLKNMTLKSKENPDNKDK